LHLGTGILSHMVHAGLMGIWRLVGKNVAMPGKAGLRLSPFFFGLLLLHKLLGCCQCSLLPLGLGAPRVFTSWHWGIWVGLEIIQGIISYSVLT